MQVTDGSAQKKEKEEVFTELMPLLKQRAVMITISDVGDGLLRINLIPRKIEGGSDENTALISPLSITGNPDELDRELPAQLSAFTESVLKTSTNLQELKAQHAAAVKALEAENKKKLDDKKKPNGAKSAATSPGSSDPAPEFKDGKPVFGTKSVAAATETRSLFETGDRTEHGTDVERRSEGQSTIIHDSSGSEES
jgi:PRTRC genetic system protein E